MKKALIAYFSQGGTTDRISSEISNGLFAKGYETDFFKIANSPAPNVKEYDLIGIGSPVYIFRPPFNVVEYIKSLPNLDGLPFFVFLLYGTEPGTAGNIIRKKLERKGGREVGYARFRGADFFVGYLQRGVLFSPDNPVPHELKRAFEFGQETAIFTSSDNYAKPPKDPWPHGIYSLERFLTMKWMTRYFYSYFFKADAEKCSSCGLCINLCPQNNIKFDKDGNPSWGRRCILCGYCEMKCPEDAVTSPYDWPIFSPLLNWNIGYAKSDPTTEYVPVIHRKGKTKRL